MSLAAKIARIGKEIGKVDKTGQNTKQNYSYIEYAEVAGRIRELFDEYGVIIVPNVDEYSMDVISNVKGGKGYHYNLRMSFTVINADDPDDKIVATWLSESADYGDKGINKAETSGTKYFLMRLFNISEKGEKESDADTPNISDTKKVDMKPSRKGPSVRDISYAKDALSTAQNTQELRTIFAMMSKELQALPEIVDYAKELKEKLEEKGEDNGEEQ